MYKDIPGPVCGKQVDEQIALHLPEMSMKKQSHGVVMARQKDRNKRVTKMWQKPSNVVLKISRRLNDTKGTIRQQFEYLNFKILNFKSTVPFIWYCSLVKEKKK